MSEHVTDRKLMDLKDSKKAIFLFLPFLKKKDLFPYFVISSFFHLFVFFSWSFGNILFFSKQKVKSQIISLELKHQDSFSNRKKVQKLPEKVKKNISSSGFKKNRRKIQQSQKKALLRIEKLLSKKTPSSSLSFRVKEALSLSLSENLSSNSLAHLKTVDLTELLRYLTEIRGIIYQNWKLPDWLDRSQLRARILIFIDQKGLISKQKIMNSSQNQIFDKKVLEALEKSTPFPPPPLKLVSFLSQGLIVEFPD